MANLASSVSSPTLSTLLVSVTIDSFYLELDINGIRQHVLFGDWVPLLGGMSERFARSVACIW